MQPMNVMWIKKQLKQLPWSGKLYRAAIGLRYRQSLNSAGYYSIRPSEDFPEFDMFLPVDSKVDLRKVRGIYEPHVQEILAEKCDDNTRFWEIGAAWGFFSLATAPRVANVQAFEAIPERVERLQRSATRNGYHNIRTTEGYVGRDVDLTEFTRPDIALMDIEGAETEVVSSFPSVFPSVSLWIIELHDPELPRIADTADPDVVETRMEDYGFDIRRVGDRRKEGNYHIIAEMN